MFRPTPSLKFKKLNYQGEFSSVYTVLDCKRSEFQALKIESTPLLCLKDSLVYQESLILSKLKNVKGVPKLIWTGLLNNNMAILTQLLGNNINKFLSILNKFSLKTVLKIALVLIEILEGIHKKNFIHKDLKPENILIGIEDEKSFIYLIDYNLAKSYKDDNNTHLKKKRIDEFNGNLKFSSVNSHSFMECSRKDDLESLGYLLLFFYLGELPWKDFKSTDIIEKISKIGETKKNFLNNVIHQNTFNISPFFVDYFKYVCSLGFETDPDYDHLKRIILNEASKNNIDLDKIQWDWEIIQNKEKKIVKTKKFFLSLNEKNTRKEIKYTGSNIIKNYDYAEIKEKIQDDL